MNRQYSRTGGGRSKSKPRRIIAKSKRPGIKTESAVVGSVLDKPPQSPRIKKKTRNNKKNRKSNKRGTQSVETTSSAAPMSHSTREETNAQYITLSDLERDIRDDIQAELSRNSPSTRDYGNHFYPFERAFSNIYPVSLCREQLVTPAATISTSFSSSSFELVQKSPPRFRAKYICNRDGAQSPDVSICLSEDMD